MVVFGDFQQVVYSRLQLIASHGGNHHSIQLGCKLPHVLLICVHQTLEKETSVITAECIDSGEMWMGLMVSHYHRKAK